VGGERSAEANLQRVARDPKWSDKLREERERGERERELRQSAEVSLQRASMQRCAVCITERSFDCGTHQALASCLCRPEKLALVALLGSPSSPASKVSRRQTFHTITLPSAPRIHSTHPGGSKTSLCGASTRPLSAQMGAS
jgi:hypothetical protein